MTAATELVTPIRHASRKLVRELGFMRRTVAGTDLSVPAVHCLIEIGDNNIHDVGGLGEILTLESDELQQTIQELLVAGYVRSEPASPQSYCLTTKGREVLAVINQFAVEQVGKALEAAPKLAGDSIAQALLQYASALELSRSQGRGVSLTGTSPIEIRTGYRPGIVARIVQMHMDFYYESLSFGRPFETELAMGYGDVVSRLDNPINQVWAAVKMSPEGEKVVGSVIIDGRDVENGGVAHLRAFIVDGEARGYGVGRKLLSEAVRFVDDKGFEVTRLKTLTILGPARHLYESFGFVVDYEVEEVKWGHLLKTLQYSRCRGGRQRRGPL